MASSSRQEYVCMSMTVDDLSYTPSEQERSRDAEQFAATGRRSWKTLKGKGEAVWPPALEAALLEALEKYHEENGGTKADRTSGRFPMRNRFVSDYIFETTGKQRSPKQVGSRLQQLRDTCKKEKILQLIANRNTPEPAITSPDCSPNNSPSPPPGPQKCLSFPIEKPLSIFVKISLQRALQPTPTPLVELVANGRQTIRLAPFASPPSNGSSYPAHTSSAVLPFLSKSVHLFSPCALLPESTVTVFSDNANSPLHTEYVALQYLSASAQISGHMYAAEIAPSFWGKLCSSQDVTQYTIVQALQVLPADPSNSSASTSSISVIYKFEPMQPMQMQRQPSPTPSLSPLIYPGSSPPASSNVDSFYYPPTSEPAQYQQEDWGYVPQNLQVACGTGSEFTTYDFAPAQPTSFSYPSEQYDLTTPSDAGVSNAYHPIPHLDPRSYGTQATQGYGHCQPFNPQFNAFL
ncbi:hypothetical protein D9613_007486 [Agrocybe pediades]|uniref:TEA domain-containing protein n=1 Tax=Agrocybe pediades TaxID=84607 RepID=A0A8H4QM41_9AGAR|nr:hypothetical protein D9613_007486 [Agrocybe pediades]KAF9563182.1 hypothetical protein CPC08DRAFT_760950 [Agrocybe pediades]